MKSQRVWMLLLCWLLVVCGIGCVKSPEVADRPKAEEEEPEGLEQPKAATGRCVIFLLDVSQSVPYELGNSMMEYINRVITTHRGGTDQVGVIVFGREPHWEIPISAEDVQLGTSIASPVDPDTTDLAAAIRLAVESFPPDCQKRMVIITDGNQTRSDALREAKSAVAAGIGIDVVPVRYHHRRDVAIERLTIPNEIVHGQPIEIRVVINNFAVATDGDDGAVSGRLKLTRRVGKHEQLLNPSDKAVELKPGENVFTFKHQIDEMAACRYKAMFAPDDPGDDLVSQNNQATAFTQVRGEGRVLFIEDADNKGEFDYLVQRLRLNNIEVTCTASDDLFTSPAELLAYDAVVLANVPRASGISTVTGFSDRQIKMLVQNTEQFGCGLVMLGGQNSFGAGGWANTELEKAMPVDFQIKNSRIRAVGALLLIMDASEMVQGNHWQKVVAREAISPLGPMDYCGLIHWGSGRDEWLWGGEQGLARIGNQREKMMARVDQMTPGDMPQFDSAMKMALAAFNRCNASVKHMIIISDGDPTKPSFTTMRGFRQARIKISTVAVGAHGQVGHKTLQDIATDAGGKYYVVKNPKALPRILQIEAQKVARPLIKDLNNVPPRKDHPHEMLQGIDEPLPPLKGFVMTTVKQHQSVDVGLYSPIPPHKKNSTILASWTYGMGRSVAFTTDAGKRWADGWIQWEDYDKFFSQMIRWSMRPITDSEGAAIKTQVRDGVLYITVHKLDSQADDPSDAKVVLPTLEVATVRLEQTGPNEFSGSCRANDGGLYSVHLDRRSSMIRCETVPSSEFRSRKTDNELLEAMAALKPEGGAAGKIIERKTDDSDRSIEVNPFRDVGPDD